MGASQEQHSNDDLREERSSVIRAKLSDTQHHLRVENTWGLLNSAKNGGIVQAEDYTFFLWIMVRPHRALRYVCFVRYVRYTKWPHWLRFVRDTLLAQDDGGS